MGLLMSYSASGAGAAKPKERPPEHAEGFTIVIPTTNNANVQKAYVCWIVAIVLWILGIITLILWICLWPVAIVLALIGVYFFFTPPEREAGDTPYTGV